MSQLFCRFVDFIFSVLFALLPDFPDISAVYGNVSSSANVIFDFLSQVNYVIPLNVIVAIILIDIGIRITFVVIYMFNKVGKIAIKVLGVIF